MTNPYIFCAKKGHRINYLVCAKTCKKWCDSFNPYRAGVLAEIVCAIYRRLGASERVFGVRLK